MKCVKCGAEMKEGCVYCSVCGHEAQILPDYSVLEDDYLRALLKDEDQLLHRGQEHSKRQAANASKGSGQKSSGSKKKKSNKIPIIVVCCILAAAIIAGIAVKVSIDHKNANSYDYQVEMAAKELTDKNYESALTYYRRALSIKPDDIVVRHALADIYMEHKEYDSAMVLLIEVISLDKVNTDAYQKLIAVYEAKEDYESIVELTVGITEKKILKLFEEYLVAEPVIYPADGIYEEFITVTLLSMEGANIYYTMDGSKPDEENGILYSEDGIRLDEAGEYEFRALCRNEKGISSEIAEASYQIELKAPDYAKISPDGGRIEGDTRITITAEADCNVYYTWDGTDPTRSSAKYQEPIEIPEGNNVLSVLVWNYKTGLNSGVYRTNFIYYP